METSAPWNTLEVAKLLVSILTPISIVILGFLFNRRLHTLECETQECRRKEEAKEQMEREELERRYWPHIEFDIECNFFGPHQGKYAAEFVLTANNRGVTKHEFKSIILRVLGTRKDDPLSFWTERYEHRLKFPEEILKDEVKPKNLNYIFVEPGVKQRLSYMTIIDAGIQYITARAEFYYEKYTPHSTEKMFEVPSPKELIANDRTGVKVS